jgi:hypothetical protein
LMPVCTHRHEKALIYIKLIRDGIHNNEIRQYLSASWWHMFSIIRRQKL